MKTPKESKPKSKTIMVQGAPFKATDKIILEKKPQ